MKISSYFLSLILLCTQVASAEEQSAREFVLCKNQEEVRILSVLMIGDKKCVAHYSKKGKDEIIAQAKSPELCHDRVKQLQGILKSANFNCRKISKAHVTSSVEATQQ